MTASRKGGSSRRRRTRCHCRRLSTSSSFRHHDYSIKTNTTLLLIMMAIIIMKTTTSTSNTRIGGTAGISTTAVNRTTILTTNTRTTPKTNKNTKPPLSSSCFRNTRMNRMMIRNPFSWFQRHHHQQQKQPWICTISPSNTHIIPPDDDSCRKDNQWMQQSIPAVLRIQWRTKKQQSRESSISYSHHVSSSTSRSRSNDRSSSSTTPISTDHQRSKLVVTTRRETGAMINDKELDKEAVLVTPAASVSMKEIPDKLGHKKQELLSKHDRMIGGGDDEDVSSTISSNNNDENVFDRTRTGTKTTTAAGVAEAAAAATTTTSSSSSSPMWTKKGLRDILPPIDQIGFYYGFTPQIVVTLSTAANSLLPGQEGDGNTNKRVSLRDNMAQTLQEIRTMRQEMEVLRYELQSIREQMIKEGGGGRNNNREKKNYGGNIIDHDDDDEEEQGNDDEDEEMLSIPNDEFNHEKSYQQQSSYDRRSKVRTAKRQRQREFEKIGVDVEKWAEQLLFRDMDDSDESIDNININLGGSVRRGGGGGGVQSKVPTTTSSPSSSSTWTEIPCNRGLRPTLNKDGRTRVFIRWMPDPRGPKHGDPTDTKDYPCIKMISTIDATIEEVCAFLAQKENLNEYNDIIESHRDLEEITPHSKITWCKSPQILFLPPREFISFCYHRWRRDGTEVVVHQACNYDGVQATAFALRGATFISKDPVDPYKTRIALLAHANPGRDVPAWAARTAVHALCPIEPFRLIHRIQQGIIRHQSTLRKSLDTEMVTNITPSGRCRRPAGIAQLGCACFWPKGGGLQEPDEQASTIAVDDVRQPEETKMLPSLVPETTEDVLVH